MPPPTAVWPAAPGQLAAWARRAVAQHAQRRVADEDGEEQRQPLALEQRKRAGARGQAAEHDAGRQRARPVPSARRRSRWCARTLDSDVNRIVAIDGGDGHLHRHDRVRRRAASSSSVSTGTIIMPPPMPSRPARKPAPQAKQQQFDDQLRLDARAASSRCREQGQHGAPLGRRHRGDRQPVAAPQHLHRRQFAGGRASRPATAGVSCAPVSRRSAASAVRRAWTRRRSTGWRGRTAWRRAAGRRATRARPAMPGSAHDEW